MAATINEGRSNRLRVLIFQLPFPLVCWLFAVGYPSARSILIGMAMGVAAAAVYGTFWERRGKDELITKLVYMDGTPPALTEQAYRRYMKLERTSKIISMTELVVGVLLYGTLILPRYSG